MIRDLSARGGQLPIVISVPGEYVFEWKFGDNDWIKIASLKLNIRDAQSTDASILPEMKKP